MLLFDITCAFNATLRGMVKDPMLLKACMESPRRHLVLDNLCREVINFENKFKNKATKKHRDLLVSTVCDMFVKSVWVEYKKMHSKMPITEKTAYEKVEEIGKEAIEKLVDMKVIQKEDHKTIDGN